MKSHRSVSNRFRLLQATPVAAAVATLLCAVPEAYAQTSGTTQTVTVTGIRFRHMK